MRKSRLERIFAAALCVATVLIPLASDADHKDHGIPPDPPAALSDPAFAEAPAPRITKAKFRRGNVFPSLFYLSSFLSAGVPGFVKLGGSLIPVDYPNKGHAALGWYQERQALGGLYEIYYEQRHFKSKEVESRWARAEVRAIDSIIGRLFPMRQGNKLRFTSVRARLDESGEQSGKTEIEFEVVGVTTAQKWAGSSADIKGISTELRNLTGDVFEVVGRFNGKHACRHYWSSALRFNLEMHCDDRYRYGAWWMTSFDLAPTARAEMVQDDLERLRPEIEAKRARAQALAEADRARARQLFNLAFELFRDGEFDTAIEKFREGLGIDPADGVAHFYAAETYARQRDLKRAREHYLHALVLAAPDTKEYTLARARLEKP